MTLTIVASNAHIKPLKLAEFKPTPRPKHRLICEFRQQFGFCYPLNENAIDLIEAMTELGWISHKRLEKMRKFVEIIIVEEVV